MWYTTWCRSARHFFLFKLYINGECTSFPFVQTLHLCDTGVQCISFGQPYIGVIYNTRALDIFLSKPYIRAIYTRALHFFWFELSISCFICNLSSKMFQKHFCMHNQNLVLPWGFRVMLHPRHICSTSFNWIFMVLTLISPFLIHLIYENHILTFLPVELTFYSNIF